MEFKNSLNNFVVYFSQVKNVRDKEPAEVSETCALAPFNRAKQIWKVMQGDGCTSMLGLIF